MSSDGRDSRYQVRQEPRSRKQLSCAECHRLKLKCDRQIPCSNCVRRECADLCPDSIKVKKSPAESSNAASGPVINELRDRLGAIEQMLARFGERSMRSRSRSRSYDRDRGQDRREYQRRYSRSRSPERDRVRERERERDWDRWPDRGRDRDRLRREPSHALEWEPSRADWDDRGRVRDQPRAEPPQRARQHYSTSPVHQRLEQQDSYGTLVIDKSGRSKWLGPTAGTEWLKNQELSSSTRPRSASPQSPSPTRFNEGSGLFPFPGWGPPPTMDTLRSHLPAPDVAGDLLDCYYENYAWNHDVAPRQGVQSIFKKVYEYSDEPLAQRVHLQQLALLFIILAMGALHNPDLPPHDPSAEHHLAASRWCLVKGDFMGVNTVPGLQALVIMAHYHLETEKGRSGDSAWPLWGLAMRLVTAMGLHIDGERWNLPDQVIQDRRHVFWECQTIDVFQSNCFSRPSSLRAEHIDTELPSYPPVSPRDPSWSDNVFRNLKFELCKISGAVLDQAMSVRSTPYSKIGQLYDRLCTFERQIPFNLRCRHALQALSSVYPDNESAVKDSPSIKLSNLHLTFQQFTLSLNVSETIIFLQRPYFIKALQENPKDPTKSMYGRSYLAIVERCTVIIEVVAGLYECFPRVTSRHWFFWYHLFTAAICIGTMIIKNSANPLSQLALVQIDHSIKLYSSVIKLNPTPSLIQNHQWLLHLRQRALSALEQESVGEASSARESSSRREDTTEDDDDDIDVKLMGWRTRLIQRATAAKKFTPPPSSVVPAQPPMAPVPQLDVVLQQHMLNGQSSHDSQQDMSTDLFLHQFWDPTIMLGSREDGGGGGHSGGNWWNWDPTQFMGNVNMMGAMPQPP